VGGGGRGGGGTGGGGGRGVGTGGGGVEGAQNCKRYVAPLRRGAVWRPRSGRYEACDTWRADATHASSCPGQRSPADVAVCSSPFSGRWASRRAPCCCSSSPPATSTS